MLLVAQGLFESEASTSNLTVCFHLKLRGGRVLGLEVRQVKPEVSQMDHR